MTFIYVATIKHSTILYYSLGVENMEHYEAYEQALQEGNTLAMTYLKLILFGTPRSGKSSTRRRLLEEINNLCAIGKNSKSTGAAESTEVIIRKKAEELTSVPFVIDSSEDKWLPLKGTQNSTGTDQNLEQWEGDLSLLAKVVYSLMLNNRGSVENVSDYNTTDSILNSDVSITTDSKSDSDDIPESDTHHLFDSTIGSDRDLNQEPEPNIELQSVNKAFNELKLITIQKSSRE